MEKNLHYRALMNGEWGGYREAESMLCSQETTDTLSVCTVGETCGGDMCFNSCKTLRGEMCKLADRNILFIDRWVTLKRAVVSGIPRKRAHIPHIPPLQSLFARGLNRWVRLSTGRSSGCWSRGYCLFTGNGTITDFILYQDKKNIHNNFIMVNFHYRDGRELK